MKRSKKTVRFPIALLALLLLSFQFTFTHVEAEQRTEIADGDYQVELSFQSLEVGEAENVAFFGRTATLAVEKGRYTLSLLINDASMMTLQSVEQLDKQIPFLVNKNENLVEFDVLDLQQVVQLQGTVDTQEVEQETTFKRQFTIDIKSLPKEEQPKPDPKPEETPDLKPDPGPDEKPTPVDPPNPKPEEKPETTPESKPEQDKPPVAKPDSDKEQVKPKPPKKEEIPKEAFLDFELLADGKKEPSIMNTYVDPVAKVIQMDGYYEVEMKLIKSAWITGLKVEKNSEMIEPEIISLENNIRTIRFTVKSLEKAKLIWVKVDIPQLNYHHDYKVQLVFDQDQVAQFIGQTNKPVKPDSSDDQKTEEQQNAITQKSKKEPVKIQEESSAVLSKSEGKVPASPRPSTAPSTSTPTAPVSNQASTTMSEPEDALAFDRLFDELKEEEVAIEDESATDKKESLTKRQPISTDVQLSTADKIKIGLLVLVLLVSGYLLVRRMKRAKKNRIDE